MSYVTTTGYGTWGNHINNLSADPADDVRTALGEFADDYDTAAIEADWREAINAALPDNVTLTGDEFIGPAYDKDKDWTGYPVQDVPAGLEDEYEGDLDIKAIVEGVDFWEIAARHEQWGIGQVAEHLGYKGPSAEGSARKTLSRLGVKAAAYRPHPDSGRPQARYNAAEVQEAAKSRPGQGARTDRAEA
ncbi:hypothetical protein [Streptomyces sp. PKU-MA01144]|uniref:hypothetical protein n=1 Tax=Streptomyces sp. PKU-MA01144 TaxID=2729138 RepID=UPI0020181F3F|nr:hypothetical protein [Streptomyces sp. PKU-MA01144]